MSDRLAHVRRYRGRYLAAILLMIVGGISILLYSGSYFDRNPFTRYPATGRVQPVLVLSLSGDMGLRYGMSGVVARQLSANGIAVLGVNSPVLFRQRRTREQVDTLIADLIRQAVQEADGRRLVLLGQSYGADMLQTGLARLPADLRARVSALILVVPGRTAYFRSDPSGLAYMGRPDSLGITTARTLDWLPVTCIYGVEEPDSLCPLLKLPNAHVVAMPGGHYMNHDDPALVAHVRAAIAGQPLSAAAMR